jgi:hypothetical protein
MYRNQPGTGRARDKYPGTLPAMAFKYSRDATGIPGLCAAKITMHQYQDIGTGNRHEKSCDNNQKCQNSILHGFTPYSRLTGNTGTLVPGFIYRFTAIIEVCIIRERRRFDYPGASTGHKEITHYCGLFVGLRRYRA